MSVRSIVIQGELKTTMSGVDTRNISRDSLFLMADLRLDGSEVPHRIKVRNLSAGGMMAEGGPMVERGTRLDVDLRNIGRVPGMVAWVQEGRFGIAFSREIDPKLARAPVGSQDGGAAPRYTRPSSILPPGAQVDAQRLRKI